MFTVYIDDSGTDPKQSVAIASALVIPSLRIVPLENEWDSFLSDEHFSSLHTSELVAGNPKSEYAGWDDPKKSRVLKRCRNVSKKYGIAQSASVSFAVNKADYDSVVPEPLHGYLGNHYTWAVRQVLHFVDNWRSQVSPGKIIGPLEYVFDWMDIGSVERLEVDTVMKQMEAYANYHGRFNEYTNYSFRHRADIPGLQCVDHIAWTNYAQARFHYSRAPLRRQSTPGFG